MSIAIIILSVVVGIALLILLYCKLTNRMYLLWGIIRFFKRKMLQPQIDSLNEIGHYLKQQQDILNDHKKEDTFFKRVGKRADKIKARASKIYNSRSIKRNFEKDKDKIESYIDFCNSKQLKLTKEEKRILNYLDCVEDLVYPEKALDKRLQRVSDEYDELYSSFNQSGEKLLSIRQTSVETINKVTELINSIAEHPKDFDTDFIEISTNKELFKNAIDFATEVHKKLRNTAIGAGAGVAAGAVFAGAAPSVAMWVATTFGTASTGTAISTLSGAAATNAALAWLGGGAVAAGGGGVAAGHALLALAGPIGLGIAGISGLSALLHFWRKKKKIQESKKQEIERIINITHSLKKLQSDVELLHSQTEALNALVNEKLSDNSNLFACDYNALSEEQKISLGTLVNDTKSLSALLCRILSE